MMAEQAYVAVDLGASGGRVLAGRFDGERMELEELHRFENGAVPAAGGLFWDVLGLWQQLLSGLRAAAGRGLAIRSVGVDTWGVDFALLGPGDVLLENPHCYRDPRTAGQMEDALRRVGRETIFSHTGLQFMPINTLYQLMAVASRQRWLLDAAQRLLMIPDLFHWLLCGEKSNEFTNATTTQFFNPRAGRWATELLAQLELPTHFLGEIAPPGTRLGPLLPEVQRETGLGGVHVVLPGTHDTASAVLAVPAEREVSRRPEWCYVSMGTWALMGTEVPSPVLSPRCLERTFTNEGGVGGTIRLLKNITGLWLVQECRRVWAAAGRAYTWEDLNRLSAAAPALRCFVDPDAAEFQAPGDMPGAMREFCRRTGQPVPADEGSVVRCALESVAMRCRQVLAALEELTASRIGVIHIVGGGTRNTQLCQAIADACARPVVAGPIEATALGNVLVQAMADGAISGVSQAREVVRASVALVHYEPHDTALWDAAYERFAHVRPA
jgi:rhamnulokinase